MFVVYDNVTINLDSVHSFWLSNTLYDIPSDQFYIKFSSDPSHFSDDFLNFFAFDSEDARDDAYRDILFALAEGKKVFALMKNDRETKKE